MHIVNNSAFGKIPVCLSVFASLAKLKRFLPFHLFLPSFFPFSLKLASCYLKAGLSVTSVFFIGLRELEIT